MASHTRGGIKQREFITRGSSTASKPNNIDFMLNSFVRKMDINALITLYYKSPQISHLPCDGPSDHLRTKRFTFPAKGNDCVEQFVCCPLKGATPIQPHRCLKSRNPAYYDQFQTKYHQSYRKNYGKNKRKIHKSRTLILFPV